MSKIKLDDNKGKPVSLNTCVKCKHYKEPDNKHVQTTWCDNPKSPNHQAYVYKGDTCGKFKKKAKDDGGKSL